MALNLDRDMWSIMKLIKILMEQITESKAEALNYSHLYSLAKSIRHIKTRKNFNVDLSLEYPNADPSIDQAALRKQIIDYDKMLGQVVIKKYQAIQDKRKENASQQ